MNLACRLLVADLDGTLTEDGEPVAEQVVAAVREFCRRGGLFTLATGRGPQSARCYLEQLAVTIPAILFNGAWLYDPVSGCPLREKALPPDFVPPFLDWLASFTGDVVVYRGEEVLIPSLSPRLERHFQKDGGRYRAIPGWAGLHPSGINKILVIAPSGPYRPFAMHFPREAALVNWVQSETDYWEILPAGVSKGLGLQELIAHLGLSPQEVVAIGNHLNDLEMLAVAGLGVAVRNAHPDLRRRAQHVTGGCSWQGVMEILRKSVLL